MGAAISQMACAFDGYRFRRFACFDFVSRAAYLEH